MSNTGVNVSERLRRIRDRHFDCFVEMASAAEQATSDREEWLAVLDSELANLRSALEWGLATRRRETAMFAVSLLWYWRARRLFNEGRQILDRVLRGSDLLPLERADALLAAAELEFDQGDARAACDRLQEARRLAASAGDAPRQARAANGLGWSLFSLSSIGPAVEAFTEARQLSEGRSVADRAQVLRGLGWARAVNEGPEVSVELHREARLLLEEAGDPSLMEHYVVETNFLAANGRVEEALAVADKCVELARATGRSLSHALEAKANPAQASGDRELLRRVLEEGIQAARSEHRPTVEAVLRRRLAEDAMVRGETEVARDSLEAGLRLLEDPDVLNVEGANARGQLLLLRARLADDEGELDLARELYRQAIAIYSRAVAGWHIQALVGLARLHVDHGEAQAGHAVEREAAGLLERMDSAMGAPYRFDLATLTGDVQAALRLATEALDVARVRMPRHVPALLSREAAALAELGRLDEALAVADELVAAGLLGPIAYLERARTHIAAGDSDAARSDLAQVVSVAPLGWASHQLQLATTLARLALLEGRRYTAAALWSAVQDYRAVNKRLAPRLAQRFEEPLHQLEVTSGPSALDSRAALDALRALVAKEFSTLV